MGPAGLLPPHPPVVTFLGAEVSPVSSPVGEDRPVLPVFG